MAIETVNVYCNTMPNSGLNVVDGGGSARDANDVSNRADYSATAEKSVSPQNRNDTTRCNINMAYYSYQKQVYQRQILLQHQQQQQLKLQKEEKQHLGREVDPEGERQETELPDKIQPRLHSQHVRDTVNNEGYSPPYRKHTSDDDSFDNLIGTVVKEAVESSDNQQKSASQKMDTSTL